MLVLGMLAGGRLLELTAVELDGSAQALGLLAVKLLLMRCS